MSKIVLCVQGSYKGEQLIGMGTNPEEAFDDAKAGDDSITPEDCTFYDAEEFKVTSKVVFNRVPVRTKTTK